MISSLKYCKFGIFPVTFILRILDFHIISEFLKVQASTRVAYGISFISESFNFARQQIHEY